MVKIKQKLSQTIWSTIPFHLIRNWIYKSFALLFNGYNSNKYYLAFVYCVWIDDNVEAAKIGHKRQQTRMNKQYVDSVFENEKEKVKINLKVYCEENALWCGTNNDKRNKIKKNGE